MYNRGTEQTRQQWHLNSLGIEQKIESSMPECGGNVCGWFGRGERHRLVLGARIDTKYKLKCSWYAKDSVAVTQCVLSSQSKVSNVDISLSVWAQLVWRWCCRCRMHRRTLQIFQSPAHIFRRRTRKTRNPWPSLSHTYIHTEIIRLSLAASNIKGANLHCAQQLRRSAEIAECTKLWLHAFRPISRITHAARTAGVERVRSTAPRALFAALNGCSSPIW